MNKYKKISTLFIINIVLISFLSVCSSVYCKEVGDVGDTERVVTENISNTNSDADTECAATENADNTKIDYNDEEHVKLRAKLQEEVDKELSPEYMIPAGISTAVVSGVIILLYWACLL